MLRSLGTQILVNEGDRHTAFSDAARNTLDGVVPNIADTESPGRLVSTDREGGQFANELSQLHHRPRANVAISPLELARQPLSESICRQSSR